MGMMRMRMRMMTRMMVMMMTRMVMMMRMREEERRGEEEKVLGQKSNNPNLMKGGEQKHNKSKETHIKH